MAIVKTHVTGDEVRTEKNNNPPLLEQFLTMSRNSIDAKGIYPQHVFYVKNGKTTVCAMALNAEELFLAVKKIMDTEKPSELIFGIDRNNKEGQDIDMKYHSVLTIAYYAIGMWSFGALPYSSFDVIGTAQWNNAWWVKTLTTELKTFNFIEPEITDEVIGTAYANKILVTAIYRTAMGQRYEGFIDKEKLSDDVKNFLTTEGLDINDRKAVINRIHAIGKKFELTAEAFGTWTVIAENGIFPARSSKTKVYLEGVEHIVETLKKII